MNIGDVSAHNKKIWAGRSISRRFFVDPDLWFPAEKKIFSLLENELRDKNILDIGVGYGRTTPPLLAISGIYTGIDYSEEMVGLCRKKFPAARFLCADARDLRQFTDAQFDCVLFSFNGLDCVSHDDRIKALSEICRVLKPGGSFVFSSHNLEYLRHNPISLPPLQLSADALQCARRIRGYVLARYHRMRNRKMECSGDGYAIVNDNGCNFSLVVYYVNVERQKEQLAAAGFSGSVVCVAEDGEEVQSDTTSPWIHYWVRK
jgi:SAM-dependent methyltransferase